MKPTCRSELKTNTIVLAAWLYVASVFPTIAFAKSSFRSYELKSGYEEVLFSDFDGDGLDDIIVIDEPNLVFFFQNRKNGFGKKPDMFYCLGDEPSIIWPAKVGDKIGHRLLVMTSEGVSTLSCLDRTTPPIRSKIIGQKTIVPDKCEHSPIVFFVLSSKTAREFPLMLVPTECELQIWRHDQAWCCVGSLQNVPEERIWGPQNTSGYTKQYWLNLNIGDLNNDGLEDLVICEDNKGRMLFRIYPQTERGSFALEPSQSYEDEWDWRKWICLQDFNRDGRVDIVKSKWLEEPWFLPGTRSGKVLVQIFMSDQRGNIPATPAFVFRKNDWISSMPILDIDGDGFMDLVLGYNRFVDSERIRKTLATKKLDHSLRIHFYDDGGFHREPDCQKALTIHLDQRNLYLSWSQRRFLETQICLDGDFDGDGDRDLLVKDKPDQASVYFFVSRKKGFSRKANMRFRIQHVERFATEDLNKDGISDLIVFGAKKDSFKVLLSKKR